MDKRFEFGKNWSHFLGVLDDERILEAEKSLKNMLGVENLKGKRFLDAGSGSGLFSLAARCLGAQVFSFDYDAASVACTTELKQRYFRDDSEWTVGKGSVLDRDYLKSLGAFDVVYSWGVLHHTGEMWQALENVVSMVKPGGTLFIAIYNDQGWISDYWKTVKKTYNFHPSMKMPITAFHAPYLFGLRFLVRLFKKRLERGMDLWYDMIDWIGGYPFECAKSEEIISFYQNKGFGLLKAKTCGRRLGCNEFVFERL